jgi:hypothetical protein
MDNQAIVLTIWWEYPRAIHMLSNTNHNLCKK